MGEHEPQLPESPTAIGMQTGMCVPGDVRGADAEIDLTDVRGTLEEALVFPPTRAKAAALDVVPGQSGAEGLAELPNARSEDPYDGP